jgi:hypothetical protein
MFGGLDIDGVKEAGEPDQLAALRQRLHVHASACRPSIPVSISNALRRHEPQRRCEMRVRTRTQVYSSCKFV